MLVKGSNNAIRLGIALIVLNTIQSGYLYIGEMQKKSIVTTKRLH